MTDVDAEAKADALLSILLEGSEEGLKQVVAQLTKNRIDGTMSEPAFMAGMTNAVQRYKWVQEKIGRMA